MYRGLDRADVKVGTFCIKLSLVRGLDGSAGSPSTSKFMLGGRGGEGLYLGESGKDLVPVGIIGLAFSLKLYFKPGGGGGEPLYFGDDIRGEIETNVSRFDSVLKSPLDLLESTLTEV